MQQPSQTAASRGTILLVTTSFPTLSHAHDTGIAGGAPFLLTESRALLHAGYRVQVLMPMHQGLERCEAYDGLSIQRFTYPLMRYNPGYRMQAVHSDTSWRSQLSLLCMAGALLWHVYRMTRQHDIRLIWANWLQVGFVASLANRRRLPLLVTIRGSDVRLWSPRAVRLMARRAPDVLNMYTDDNEIRGWIEAYGFREVAVPNVYVPQPIDRRPHPAGRKNITVIGRLDGEPAAQFLKGLGENLFIVLARLLAMRDDLRVTVIGSGRRLEAYQHLLAGFGERVEFTGWLRDFSHYLSQAYCVLGGSGLNGVIMDTVPNGIPVLISQNLTGTLWQDRHNCVVFDPNDLQSLQCSLEFALDHAELLDEYASRARQDLQRFARPVEQAAAVWAERLEEFCSLNACTAPSD